MTVIGVGLCAVAVLCVSPKHRWARWTLAAGLVALSFVLHATMRNSPMREGSQIALIGTAVFALSRVTERSLSSSALNRQPSSPL